MADVTLLSLLQSALHYLRQGQLPPQHVLTLIISKGLGFAIIIFSSVVKVPQIVAVGKAQSAEGLAPISFELEQLGLCIHASYGFLLGLPFNAYGEASIILLQNTFLLYQVYRYSRAPSWRWTSVALVLSLGAAAVLRGQVPKPAIRRAYDLNNLIFVAARVPQIYQNFKAGSTGQLSVITAFANFAGNLARIFTSVQENAGAAMIRAYIIGAVLNGTVLFQILYFGNRKPSKAGKKSSKSNSKGKPGAAKAE